MGPASASKQQQAVPLTELLQAAGSTDVLLQFDSGDTAPAHSQILQLWSGVLRGAIQAEISSSGKFSSSKPLTIPMPGTAKELWLLAAVFMYPVVPRPAASFENLEALLIIGSKYDCPRLLSEALGFIRSLTTELSVADPKANTFAWKWIHLADANGISEGASTIIDTIAAQDYGGFAASCNEEGRLAGLSPETLQHVVRSLTAGGRQRGIAYCVSCRVQCKFLNHGTGQPLCSRCRNGFSAPKVSALQQLWAAW